MRRERGRRWKGRRGRATSADAAEVESVMGRNASV